MPERTNKERAERFNDILTRAAASGDVDADDDATMMVDLLANAMHWCDAHGVDFEAAAELAQRHHADERGVCGFCGQPDADKVPHPIRWPGERSAGTEFVHAACEDGECGRAHSLLTDRQREEFLRHV